jgi:hypothetical protein
MPPEPITPPQHPLLPHGPDDFDFKKVIKRALPNVGDKTETLSFLDNYDRAMAQWLRGVLHWDGRYLPIVFASPLRAFSAVQEILSDDPDAVIPPPADGQLDYPTLPLPFISFWRGDLRPGVRRNQNFPVRNIGFIDGSKKRRTGTMRFPTPINLPYQVELWCKTYTTQGILIQQLLTQFWTTMAYWLVNTPYNRQIFMPIKLVSSSDTSELEAGSDTKDRILRYTFQLEVEGRMFHDVYEVPTYMRRDVQIEVQNPDGTSTVVDQILSEDVTGSTETPAPPSLEQIAKTTVHEQPED